MGSFDDVLAVMIKDRKLLPYQAVAGPQTVWNNEYILLFVRIDIATKSPFVKIWQSRSTSRFRYSFSDIFVSNTFFENEEQAKRELDEFLITHGAILLTDKLASMV